MITYVTIFTLVTNDITNFLDTTVAVITIVIDVPCLPYSHEGVRSFSFCWYFLSYLRWEEKVAPFAKKNFWIKVFLIDTFIKQYILTHVVYFLNFFVLTPKLKLRHW